MLRRYGELDIDEETATLLADMSAATIDRRWPGAQEVSSRGRHDEAGHLLKSQIPVRTWADWDDAVRGFVRSTWSAMTVATRWASMSGR